MQKRLVYTIMLALTLAPGLALASCGGKDIRPIDEGGNCSRQQFPQCGPTGTH